MESGSEPSTWFKRPKPRANAKRNLFVFHHAGGSAGFYWKWRENIPEDTELLILELPGRGTRHREPAISDFDELMAAIRAPFEAALTRPSILFGHSLGALVAFELCRELCRKLGSRESLHTQGHIRGLALSSLLPPTPEVLAARKKISNLPDVDLLREISAYAPLPAEALSIPDVRAYFVGVIRKDIALLESYENRDFSRSPIPLWVLSGEDDAQVPGASLADWARFSTRAPTFDFLPGGHFYISTEYPTVIRMLLARKFS